MDMKHLPKLCGFHGLCAAAVTVEIWATEKFAEGNYSEGGPRMRNTQVFHAQAVLQDHAVAGAQKCIATFPEAEDLVCNFVFVIAHCSGRFC